MLPALPQKPTLIREYPSRALQPGTGTPEVGGLTPREVLIILRGIAGTHIIGGDVMEVAPQYDATTNTAQVAAQMLFTELCLVALEPKFVSREARRHTPSV